MSVCNNPPKMYHEKQHFAMCALHSLNNFFQKPLFTKKSLDLICEK